MSRLNLTTPFEYNGETLDHLHVRMRTWVKEPKTETIEGVQYTQVGTYRVLYALHRPSTVSGPNSDCRKMFTVQWNGDDPDEPWNKDDQWLLENNGHYAGTYQA